MRRLLMLAASAVVVCGLAGCSSPSVVIEESKTEKTERVIEKTIVDPGDKGTDKGANKGEETRTRTTTEERVIERRTVE